MEILNNYSLGHLNTFGVEASARKLIKIHNINDLLVALTVFNGPFNILGGGSNILLTEDIHNVVLKNEIKGIEVIDEDSTQCMVKVGGGENWHHFVMWCVYHNLGGLENLALIPGSVGAAPIQNIGAYGVEQDEYFHSATLVDLEMGLTKTFFKKDCKFGYRDSVFKNFAKDQYMVCDVTYVLTKNKKPTTSYKDVHQHFIDNNISHPSIENVADAIISIRSAKLPNPKHIGNAGSFFKNPIIEKSQLEQIVLKYPDIVYYEIDDPLMVKLPAAWLIDKCGYKGATLGNTGTYKNQALVIVNHGGATGQEILDFSKEIQLAVNEKFGITLTPEVNVW